MKKNKTGRTEEKKIYLIRLRDSLVVLSKTPKLSRMDIVNLKLQR